MWSKSTSGWTIPCDFAIFNRIDSQYFSIEHAPARVTVQGHMMNDFKVEMDCVAWKEPLMNASFDVVIVGGGVNEAAVGYGLAETGREDLPCGCLSPPSPALPGPTWAWIRCQSAALGCPQFVLGSFGARMAAGGELKNPASIRAARPRGGIIPVLGSRARRAPSSSVLQPETEDATARPPRLKM